MLINLTTYIVRQIDWSRRTFGPGERTSGVIKHIQKELQEIQANPKDIYEWVDVIILALDGAWRAGHSAEEIALALHDKQEINFGREWPDWRQFGDEPIEHIRKED